MSARKNGDVTLRKSKKRKEESAKVFPLDGLHILEWWKKSKDVEDLLCSLEKKKTLNLYYFSTGFKSDWM